MDLKYVEAYENEAAFLEERALKPRPTTMHDMGAWVCFTTPDEDRVEATRLRAEAAMFRSWLTN